MLKPKLRHLPLAAAALVACAGAHAYQSPDGNFSLSGFGTLGFVHTSTNDVQFNYPGQGGGAGTAWNSTPDTKLAVQGTYKIAPTLSGTVQVMMKHTAFAQYEPSIDWAFLKWQAAPSLSFRAGKMGAPFFMVSDFRNVGYANTTVRPNLDVYGQVPTDQFEGLDGTFQHNLGSATLNATLWYGNSKADYASAFRKTGLDGTVTQLNPSAFELRHAKGLNLSAEMDNGLTLRAGYVKAKFNVTSPSIDNLLASGARLSAVGPTTPTIGPGYTAFNTLGASIIAQTNALVVTQNKEISFLGFGAAYDQDNWVIAAEYTRRGGNSFVADTTGWYGNVGYRVGKFTPYAGISRLSVKDPNVGNPAVTAPLFTSPDPRAAFNPTLVGAAASANDGLQSLLNVEKLSQHTYTIGSRWDVLPNVALKAQWDQVHKPADAWGLFFTPDPGVARAKSFLNNRRKVNVLSVSMDVVF